MTTTHYDKIQKASLSLFQKFGTITREWVMSTYDLKEIEFHEAMLGAVAMLMQNHTIAASRASGKSIEEIQKQFAAELGNLNMSRFKLKEEATDANPAAT